MQFCRVFISCSRHQAVSSLHFLGHSVIAFFIIELVVLTNDMFVAEAVAYLLLLAVGLLCAYEFCAVYVTAGASASELHSPSGFFFGVSAISLAINMLFICKILFNGKASNFLLLLVVSICHSSIGTWLTSLFFARFMHSKWIWCWWICAEVVQICLFWLCWSGSCFMLSWSTRS